MINIQYYVSIGLAFLLAITIHEFAHARAAYSAGDETPKLQGRLSLNPIDHLDPIGTLILAATIIMGSPIVFGWGKPVQTSPYNYKSPRKDGIRVALWGPASNIITAFVLAMVLRFVPMSGTSWVAGLLSVCVRLNLVLAFFNLLPIRPLDGSHIISGLLPADTARAYDLFMMKYGMFVLIALIVTRATLFLVGIPASLLYLIFVGLP